MIEQEMTFNIRQYQRMLDKIDRFKDRRIEINSLITELDALIRELRDVPKDWQNELRQAWAVLDEVYALALDEGKKAFDDRDKELIESALSDLTNLIKRRIGH